MDATVAYRRACLNAIEYLKTFGYTGEQAYLLLGSAPIEGRISGIVDIPNACCSLYLPTAIFDFDIRPTKDGPASANGYARRDELTCLSTCSPARHAGRSSLAAGRGCGGRPCRSHVRGSRPAALHPAGRLPHAGAIARGP